MMGAARSIHFSQPSVSAVTAAPAVTEKEYLRPDIVVLGSIRSSSDQIREELKVIGAEETYATALRVIKTQSELIAKLSAELLSRHEEAGIS